MACTTEDEIAEAYGLDEGLSPRGWGDKAVSILTSWRDRWEEKARLHDKLCQMYGILHVCLATNAIVLPLVLPKILEPEELEYGYMPLSILAALMSFLNLASRASRHRSAAHAYNGLCLDVHVELSRPPMDRRKAVFAISDFRAQQQHVSLTSPLIPQRMFCPCQTSRRQSRKDAVNRVSEGFAPEGAH
jgi:hypothetical protein